MVEAEATRTGGGERAGAIPAPWGWSGVAFVVAFVASIVVGNLLAVGPSLYLPEASVTQTREFYSNNDTVVLAQSALQILAAVALAWFGLKLAARWRSIAYPPLARMLSWSAGIAAGALLTSVGCVLVLSVLGPSADDTTVSALAKAALLLGGPVHLLSSGLLIVLTSVTGRRVRLAPRWLMSYGRIAGPLVMASALVRPEPAFRIVAAVWIIGVGLAVARGILRPSTHPHSRQGGNRTTTS
jgi:hypothetical protein